MKKIFTSILLSCFVMCCYAQSNPTNTPLNKDLEKLISKAIANGADANGVYHLENKNNKNISANEAKKYLVAKTYVAISTTEKEVAIFGDIVKVIDKINFITMDNFKQYAFSVLNKNRQVSYSQLKNTGKFFIKVTGKQDTWWRNKKVNKIENVSWSGGIANGFLGGKGVGFVNIDGSWCYFEGNFAGGFPMEKITLIKLSKLMAVSSEELEPFYYQNVMSLKSRSGDLRAAVTEYAKTQYDDFKRKINAEFDRALTLNNQNGEYQYFWDQKELIKKNQDMLNDFIEPYTYLNVDPDGYLLKAKELQELYSVLEALNIDTRKSYINESLIGGTSFNKKSALADTASIGRAWDIALVRVNDSKASFKQFYIDILRDMGKKADAIYDNINRNIAEYNSMEKSKSIFEMANNSSSRSSSSSYSSDRDNSDDSYDSRRSSDNSSSSSSGSYTCTVKLKNPDWENHYYCCGSVTVYFYPHSGGYKKYQVDGEGVCTITWDPSDRGEYIDRITFSDYDEECIVCANTHKALYEVSDIKITNGGNHTFTAHKAK